MDVFTASLRSACSLRRGHFVNNLTYLLISFSTLAAEVNQNKVQQKNNLENFALSICLAEGFPDGEINSEAFSAVGAYVELGAYPVEAYEEVSELAKNS